MGRVLPVDAAAGNPLDISAHNSPSLAVNPTDRANLAVSDRVDSPRFSCALHHSRDGGATWARTEVPIPAGEEPKCYAPDVVFDAAGTLQLSYVTLQGEGNVPDAVWMTSSSDGGATLSPPRRVLGRLAFQVRLLADDHRPGRLYLSWVQASAVGTFRFAGEGNPVEVMRSDDGGASWSAPVRVSPPSRLRVVAPSTALGTDGSLLLLYLDLGDDRLDYEGGHGGRGGDPYPGRWMLVLARSPDAGASWSESAVDAAVVPTRRFIVFLPPFPSLAVDRRTGRVYAAFEDRRAGDPDVEVWASGDGGRSFEAPVRVNDTPLHDGGSQYLPRLAVAPGGRLDVVYYDRRDDAGDVMTEVSMQSSYDGGRSFTPRLRLSDRGFDSRVGYGSERGLADLGSRLAVTSTDGGALAVWADTRAGTEASAKQDLAEAVVAFDAASSDGRWRNLAAVALVLAGAAAVVAANVVGRGVRRGTRA